MPYVSDGSLAGLYDDADVLRPAREIVERVQDRLLELVKRFTPVATPDPRDPRARPPGTLRESWEKGPIEELANGRFRASVFTLDRIAPYVEYPTRPHEIRARAGRALRFFADGEEVFAVSVHHPGTKGAFMMGRAIAAVSAEWQVIAREELGAGRAGVVVE